MLVFSFLVMAILDLYVLFLMLGKMIVPTQELLWTGLDLITFNWDILSSLEPSSSSYAKLMVLSLSRTLGLEASHLLEINLLWTVAIHKYEFEPHGYALRSHLRSRSYDEYLRTGEW